MDELEFDGVIAPSVELPPAMPLTSQAMAVVVGTQREAVKTCVALVVTLAVAGESELEAAQAIVTLAEADFDESAMLVAVTLTVEGEGTVAGAV
jgi:hypothetical protein